MPIQTLQPISGISPIQTGIRADEGLALPIPGSGAGGTGVAASQSAAPSFGQTLAKAISEVNASQVHAADMTTRFAAGDRMDIHQVMIAMQEASTSLSLAIQVRNKLVDSYQEIMRVNM